MRSIKIDIGKIDNVRFEQRVGEAPESGGPGASVWSIHATYTLVDDDGNELSLKHLVKPVTDKKEAAEIEKIVAGLRSAAEVQEGMRPAPAKVHHAPGKPKGRPKRKTAS